LLIHLNSFILNGTERKRKHEVNFIFIFMFISSRYQRLKSLPDVFIRGN